MGFPFPHFNGSSVIMLAANMQWETLAQHFNEDILMVFFNYFLDTHSIIYKKFTVCSLIH